MTRRTVFGTASAPKVTTPLRRSLDQQQVNRAIARRLAEKIAAFDREAARLEFRGQFDAAKVLRSEAQKLRAVTRRT